MLLPVFLFHTLHSIGLSCCCASYDRRVYFHVCFLYLSNKTITILPPCLSLWYLTIHTLSHLYCFFEKWKTEKGILLRISAKLFNLKGFLSHQTVNHKDAVESYYQFMENCFQLPPHSRFSSNYCKIKYSILGYISHQLCWLAWLRMTVLPGFFWSQHISDMREWGWAAKIWQILSFKGRTERRTHAKKVQGELSSHCSRLQSGRGDVDGATASPALNAPNIRCCKSCCAGLNSICTIIYFPPRLLFPTLFSLRFLPTLLLPF